jgi:autotransporter-associated beta strand protein
MAGVAPGMVLPQLVWSGRGSNNDWSNAANWTGGSAPANDGSEQLIFGPGPKNQLTVDENFDVDSLVFSGNFSRFSLSAAYDSSANLMLEDGLTVSPTSSQARVTIDSGMRVTLANSQTWNITAGTLEIQTGISDYYFYNPNSERYESTHSGLTKTGAGRLELNHSNSYSGGTILDMGTLAIGHNSSLGTGTLTFSADSAANAGARPTLEVMNGDRTLNNAIVLNGALRVSGEKDLKLTGNVFLNQNTVVSMTNRFIRIDGNITSEGPSSLTLDSYGFLLLTGDNGYKGGTISNRGVLLFGSAYAIPSVNLDSGTVGHLTAGANGYIGFADSEYTSSIQSYFINDFNKSATLGTVGLDSDPDSSPNTYSDNIDLTGFGATARLGSATKAILTGTITPQGTDYRFGGGGGWLQTDSALTGARALVLDSPVETPLTLRLTNPGNNYSAGTSVTRSGVVFAAGALPAGASNVIVNAGGYAGSEGTDLAGFLAHLNVASTGMIGFDATPGNTRTISDNLDLSAFTGQLFLGTATAPWIDSETKALLGAGLRLTGTITPAGGSSQPFRFGAYKGGMLEVASNLTGTHGIIIGDASSLGSFGDINNQEYSTVLLSGDNSALTGGIQLNAGRLAAGASKSLGSGSVTVNAFTFPTGLFTTETPPPQLAATADDVVLANNFQLNTQLSIGGPKDFEIAGVLAGPGGLRVEDSRTLSLSGNNTFSGGITVTGGASVGFYHDNASGTGLLKFSEDSSSSAYFYTSHPVVGGLASDYYAHLTFAADNTVFTVNQAVDASLAAEIRSNSESDAVRFVKSGTATLRLDNGGLYYHSGVTGSGLTGDPAISLQVNQGTLIVSNNFYIEDSGPTIWLHGGTFAVEGNKHVYNPLVIDNGGKLAGGGIYSQATIGPGATLSPGLADSGNVGFITFTNHLTLAGGGTYEWNIGNPDPGVSAGHDGVSVGSAETLEITATSADRFTLRIISLDLAGNPGVMTDVIPGELYAWTLMSSLGITGFDPAAFTLDVSQFTTDRGTGLGAGAFTVSQNGTNLMLNFAAVPEPSTYALLALGLGLVAATIRRRRQAV